jgi:CBS domain-containing protein
MSSLIMPVRDFMSSPVHTVYPGDPLAAAYAQLRGHRISSLAVVDMDQRPVGVVSRTDLIRAGRLDAGRRPKAASLVFPDKQVADVMTEGVRSVTPTATMQEAAKAMVDGRVHRVFVVEDEQLLGVVSTKDVMRAIGETKLEGMVSDHMSSPVFTVRSEEPLALATERLERARVSGVVVVENGRAVGIFTQVESLLAADWPRDTPVDEVMSAAMLCLDADTPLHRAAAQAAVTRARRVIVTREREMVGILTGIDFARVAR